MLLPFPLTSNKNHQREMFKNEDISIFESCRDESLNGNLCGWGNIGKILHGNVSGQILESSIAWNVRNVC